MLYCFSYKEGYNDRTKRVIERAKKEDSYIYYNKEQDKFLDRDEQVVEVLDKTIMPISDVRALNNLIEALEKQGAIIPNARKDIDTIKEWYKHIPTKRKIIYFTGHMLSDNKFLKEICNTFSNNEEIFLKTKEKDFNGIISLEELINPESDLRKAFSYHQNDEFILSEKINIDKDEIGKKEYRTFIYDDQIMNISRITDNTYHKIPIEVLDKIQKTIKEKPQSFPTTFVLDIFSSNDTLDITELNPLEASGKYLYNTIFEFSNDLLHNNIESVPEERIIPGLGYTSQKDLEPSTLNSVNKSFAKDYKDIKTYGERIEGFIHISGLPEGVKVDISSLLDDIEIIENDEDFSKNNSSLKTYKKINQEDI